MTIIFFFSPTRLESHLLLAITSLIEAMSTAPLKVQEKDNVEIFYQNKVPMINKFIYANNYLLQTCYENYFIKTPSWKESIWSVAFSSICIISGAGLVALGILSFPGGIMSLILAVGAFYAAFLFLEDALVPKNILEELGGEFKFLSQPDATECLIYKLSSLMDAEIGSSSLALV